MRLKALHIKLADYSLLSGAFILMHQAAAGQVVYTDIDPDIEIEFDGQSAGIDIDNNGTIDFAFLKSSWSYDFWNSYSSTLRLRRKIWAGPELETNQIAGDYFTHGAGYGTSYHPYALTNGSPINEALSFQNWGLQTMAGAHIKLETFDDWNFDGGHWIFDEEPQFLGVKFIGQDECMHYGWVRCSVIDTANVLIIFDYAYETKCETGILAGDTIGDTSGVSISELNIFNATIYSFNNNIYINIPNYQNTQITVYDISGNKIYNKILEGNSAVINMENFAAGIYVVSVKQGENVVRKKVNVE